MNEIITAEAGESALPASARAIQITERIRANGRTAVNAVCAIGKDLRTVKIEELYKEIGYESFEDYAKQEFALEKRQAQTYISTFEKLGEEFMQANAQLGITRLAMLATANPEDRAEIMESTDIAHITTRELEQLLAEKKQQGEQLSMLQEEKEELGREKTNNDRMIHALQQKVKELEQKNAELESAPVEVAVKEVQVPDKKTEKKLKDVEKELKQKDVELQNARALKEKAEQEAITLRNEYEGKLKELQKAAEKPAQSSDKSNFKAMLASAYKELTGLVEYISISEPEDRKTYMQAVYKILNASKDALGKIDPCIEVEGEE